MNTNVGKVDRLLRIVLGGVLFLAYLEGITAGIWSIVALLAAAVLMITAIAGSCPIYSLLKWKTTNK